MQKYIVIDNIKFILFDITISHSVIGEGKNVTSAGFVENGVCTGRSDSLNINSKESDNLLLKCFLKSTFS